MKAFPISLLLFLFILGIAPAMAQKAKPAAKGKPAKAAPTRKTPAKQDESLAAKALKKERIAILDEICACVKNEGLNNLNEESQNQKFGLCLLEARGNHHDAFIKIYGDQANEEDYSWAEKVGMDLGVECPYISRLILQAQSDSAASESDSAAMASRPMTPAREKILNTMCQCFDEKKNSTDSPMVKITSCLMKAYEADKTAFEAEYGKIGPDSDNNRQVGEMIGAELAPRCPSFMNVVVEMVEERQKQLSEPK